MIRSLTKLIISKVTFIKFASIGGLATLTHAITYLYILELDIFSAQYANIIGFLVAFSVSYIGQRKWTFLHIQIENEFTVKIKFIASSIASLSLNAMWVYLAENILYTPVEYSSVGIIFITPIITFIILKYWVFTESSSPNQLDEIFYIINIFGNYKQLIYYIICCFVVFYLTHGKGIIVNWYNPDDWANRAGHVWIGSEGRWLSDIIYKYLYKFTPNNLYQFFVAASAYAITPILALHTLKTKLSKLPLYYFIFLATVIHPYQVDVLNFDMAIAIYPIALVLTLIAGNLCVKNKSSIILTTIAVLLIFLSSSIYQSIIFIILIPFSLNVFNTGINKIVIFYQFLKLSIVTILGLFLHFIASKYYTTNIIKETSRRLQFDTLNIQNTFDSIIDLPSQFVTHTLALHPIVSDLYSYYMAGIFLVVLLLLIFLTIKSICNNQYIQLGSLIISLCLINLPIYFFQIILATIEINAPARIMYLNNLNLSLSIILIIKYYFGQSSIIINSKYIFSLSIVAFTFAVIGVYTSGIIWDNQKNSFNFDLQLTNNIYQQIQNNITNKDKKINITFYGNLPPKTPVAERFLSVGKTAYNTGSFKYIFESLYNITPQYSNNIIQYKNLCSQPTPKLTLIKKEDTLFICLYNLLG